MEIDELMQELESLVVAMEDSLAVIAGTIAETAPAGVVLAHLLAGKSAMETSHGPNEWRDRLLRSAARIVALKAHPLSANDPALQSLIASVLPAPPSSDRSH